MYQIVRITDKNGAVKTGPEDAKNLGCMGDAKMDDGCVLFTAITTTMARPATGSSAPAW